MTAGKNLYWQHAVTRCCVATYLPSPYQVELFDAIHNSGELDLTVIYLKSRDFSTPIARHWASRALQHRAIVLDVGAGSLQHAAEAIRLSDLVVFNYYRHPAVYDWLKQRALSGRPWCFWGERPGFGRLGMFGRLYRIWKLWPLRRSRAPIWGIGRWALEEYAKEFGTNRRLFNVPYASNLARFSEAGSLRRLFRANRRFLYSGALIKRKGVDLLVAAFGAVAREFPKIGLALVGAGGLEPHLRAQARHLGDRVEFKGFQSWDDLPRNYAQADILVAPSRYDGWGLVVPEALAAGLPVISTTSTGAALEFIRCKENGWLIPPGRFEPLRDALCAAASVSDHELQFMSEAAHASVSQHQLSDGVRRFCQAVARSLDAFRP